MSIELGCHKWSFAKADTLQAAKIIRALGFERMDLGNAPDVDPIHTAQHPAEAIAHLNRIKVETGVQYIDVFPQLPGLPLNHPDPERRRVSREHLRPWFDIAARVGCQGITLGPGSYWPGRSVEEDFALACEELRWCVAQGEEYGLLTRIEPHVSSVAWTPFAAVEMVQRVPGLSLTLDHSHFVFHDIPYEHIALMHPYGTHWHARQAAPGEICTPTDRGTVDFARIVRDLKTQGYEGTIALEFTPGLWMTSGYVDCVSETIALTAQLREWLAEEA